MKPRRESGKDKGVRHLQQKWQIRERMRKGGNQHPSPNDGQAGEVVGGSKGDGVEGEGNY